MNPTHQIVIEGFGDPKEFVRKWSQCYSYGQEIKYSFNIKSALDSENSFQKLYEWKNGTGDTIYEKKKISVDALYSKINIARELRETFSWNKFEREFNPTESSTIWKIFLLHLINPNDFPIYDQHVYRFYHFHKLGKICEVPSSRVLLYESYKNEYRNWFNRVQLDNGLSPKEMDEAFFSYGKALKNLNKLPIDIIRR